MQIHIPLLVRRYMMKRINIVLFQPEIPQNTGNIMRSCVGFNCKLHLIRPLGFKLDEKHLQNLIVTADRRLDAIASGTAGLQIPHASRGTDVSHT